MTKEQRQLYQNPEKLREIILQLKGKKFKLDCGHHVTFGHFLGSDITIRNGANPEITCSLCGY
ncbi:MAG: hypothetical protein ABIJ59_12200 [Pseudomonadota bacterium]